MKKAGKITKKLTKAVSDVSIEKSSTKINVAVYDTFKNIYGNLNIPVKFVVPKNDPLWPVRAYGLDLADYTKRIRSSIQKADGYYNTDDINQLFEKGFHANSLPETNRVTTLGFQTYKAKTGSFTIEKDFVVPADESWPQEIHGMHLGTIFDDLKNYKLPVHDGLRKDLTVLGFNLNDQPFSDPEFQVFWDALVVYKSIHNSLKMSISFVIPEDPQYPQKFWGLPLGGLLNSIRIKGEYPQYKRRLLELGVEYALKKHDFHRVYSASVVFKALHGDLDVPTSYVVPVSSVYYPKDTYGIPLGMLLKDVPNNVSEQQRDAFVKLGWVFKPPKAKKAVFAQQTTNNEVDEIVEIV
jgi:hypothetical protein